MQKFTVVAMLVIENGHSVSLIFFSSMKSTYFVLEKLYGIYCIRYVGSFLLYLSVILCYIQINFNIFFFFPGRFVSILCLAYNLVMLSNSSVILIMAKQVGYYFAPSGKPYPDNWIITDVIYEFEGSLITR